MRAQFDEVTRRLADPARRRAARKKLRTGLAGLALLSIPGLPGVAVAQVQPQPVWTSTIGTAATPKAMTLDSSGNIIVAGYDAGDYLTAKYSPGGTLLWSSRQSGKVGELAAPPGVTALALDQAGNIYVTGGLGGNRSYNTTICFFGCTTYRVIASDQVTIKYNSNGQRQWVANYSPQGDTWFNGSAIAVDKAGNVYVTGTVTIKYDANGNQVWLRTNLSADSLVLDAGTNLYLGAATSLRKFDKDANLLWTRPVNSSGLKLDAAGNLYTSGTTYAGPTTKLDDSGAILWTAPFGGLLALDAEGSVCLASVYTGATYPHYATVKLDGQGGMVWQAINDHGYYNSVSVSGVAADSAGNVYVTGQDNGAWGTLKYNADGLRVWESHYNAGGAPLLAVDAATNIYLAGTLGGFLLIKYTQAAAPGAPVIAPPPVHPLVRPGEDVTLSVNATGAGPLNYQWRTVQTLIPDATNTTLLLTNVQASQAGMYSVEVTNALGSAASPEIYLAVLSPLPSQTVVLGATAVFRAPLSGGGPAAFHWRFNGANVSGETNATLAVPNVGPSQAGDYDVVVSNYYGNVLTSTVAQLNLNTRVTQSWAGTVPDGNVGDVARAVGVDAAGNVFVTGYSSCGHKTVKYNAAGQELWENCDTNFGALAGLVVDPAGAVCVAGGSVATKYAATGALFWTAPFNDGAGSSNGLVTGIAVDSAGSFYVTGSIADTNAPGILTVKYNPNGQQVWATRHPGTTDDFAQEVAVDGAGNAYVCGAVLTATSYDFIVIKYDAYGTPVWTNTYDGPTSGQDIAAHLTLDNAGFVYVTGWSPGTNYVNDFATIKYDAAGSQVWVARYQGPGGGEDNPHGLAVDAFGNVYVAGSSVGADYQYHIATIKYAPDGTPLWLQRYTGPANGNDYCRALALDNAGNVYVQGHSDTGPGPTPTTEVVTLSYDTDGNPRWAARCETGIETKAYYRNGALAVDSSATVYVADTTFLGGSPAFLTLKYVQRTRVPARLSAPTISPNGQLHCVLTGEAGVRYTIQVSSDLLSWTTLTSVLATSLGGDEFTDTIVPGSDRRFYRAVEP
jgi:hypothetical protein